MGGCQSQSAAAFNSLNDSRHVMLVLNKDADGKKTKRSQKEIKKEIKKMSSYGDEAAAAAFDDRYVPAVAHPALSAKKKGCCCGGTTSDNCKRIQPAGHQDPMDAVGTEERNASQATCTDQSSSSLG